MGTVFPTALVVLAVLTLAFGNGANDNFKGVATLWGCGRVSFKVALSWATATTILGSAAAFFLGARLVAAFSGKGLVPDELVGDAGFASAVAAGAASTILLATRIGMPVSTTHALLGGIVGAALAWPGGGVVLRTLGQSFLLPLALSPLVALLVTTFLYRLARRLRRDLGIQSTSCLCVEAPPPVAVTGPLRLASAVTVPPAVVVHRKGCPALSRRMAGITAQDVLDGLHFLSAGAVGFARGLNDTPKIVALLLVARAFDDRGALALVGLAMALGGLLAARRVAATLSHGITPMNDGQALTANLVTATLVLVASRAGLPVSTTHVSVGSLFGIGASHGTARRRAVVGIVAAWVGTLPLAMCLAAMTAYLVRLA